MQISDKVFLISGGASGLGEACARRLHEHGAKLVIADLNQDAGTALAQELGARARPALGPVRCQRPGSSRR